MEYPTRVCPSYGATEVKLTHIHSRYQRPFDRHDWVVDRCGTKVRYVIDYYTGRVDKGNPFSFYIDARPALDSWEGVKMRMVSLWEGLIGK